MDITTVILQLSSKIQSIKKRQDRIKCWIIKFSNISNQVQQNRLPQLKNSMQSQLKSSMQSQLKSSIQSQLKKYNAQNRKQIIFICEKYEQQIEQQRGYYQYEIEQLKSQIHRQYKVIGLMKQQVEDLMMLLNQQHNNRIIQNQSRNGKQQKYQENLQDYELNCSQKDKKASIKLDLRTILADQLQTIVQEQTERTFVSNCDLNQLNNYQFNQQLEYLQTLKKSQQQQNQPFANQQNEQALKQVDFIQIGELSEYQKKFLNQNKNIKFNIQVTQKQHNQQQQNKLSIESEQQIGSFQNQQDKFLNQSQINKVKQSRQSQKYDNHKNSFQNRLFQQNQNEKWSSKGVFQYIDYQQSNQSSFPSTEQSKMLQPIQIQHLTENECFFNCHQNYIPGELKTQNYIPRELKTQKPKQKNVLQYLQEMVVNQSKSNSRVSSNTDRQLKNVDFNSMKNNSKGSNHKLQYLSDKRTIENSDKRHDLKEKQNIQFYKKGTTHKQSQSKTKQFLQQFRKTFNKCLSAIEVSKKHSTKIIQHKSSASKYEEKFDFDFLPSPVYTENILQQKNQFKVNQDQKSISPQSSSSPIKNKSLHATFGKNRKSIQKQRKSFQSKKQFLKKGKSKNTHSNYQNQCITQNKYSSSQSVNIMMKDLEDNNKFLVGSKQLQLKYEGQKKQGQRNGNGILHYSNGLWYEGQFKYNMRNGYGILRFNHIQLYNGEWKDDQLYGQGKIRNCAIINKKKTIQSNNLCNSSNPLNKWISYCGYFKKSRFQGQGTLYLQGGQKFMGVFVSGNANGEGTLYRKNGQVQMGTWKNNFFIELF